MKINSVVAGRHWFINRNSEVVQNTLLRGSYNHFIKEIFAMAERRYLPRYEIISLVAQAAASSQAPKYFALEEININVGTRIDKRKQLTKT